MALAADTIERHRERQRMDRLGTPVHIAASVPLIVYTARNEGQPSYGLTIEGGIIRDESVTRIFLAVTAPYTIE